MLIIFYQKIKIKNCACILTPQIQYYGSATALDHPKTHLKLYHKIHLYESQALENSTKDRIKVIVE